jgi:hypothetical protein
LLTAGDFIDSVIQQQHSQILGAAVSQRDQTPQAHEQGAVARDDDHFAVRLSDGQSQGQRNGAAHRGRVVIEIECML